AGAAFHHKRLYGSRIVHPRGPLNDVVMMLAPIQLADVEAMRAHVAVVRQPRRGAEIQVPIQSGGNRFRRTEASWPENPAAVAISTASISSRSSTWRKSV